MNNHQRAVIAELTDRLGPAEYLTHLEPAELAAYIDEHHGGDPRCDVASHFTAAIDDMAMVDRPKMNALVRKMLLGKITVDEQARLNELAVKAMLEHGLHAMRVALDQKRVGHVLAHEIDKARRGAK